MRSTIFEQTSPRFLISFPASCAACARDVVLVPQQLRVVRLDAGVTNRAEVEAHGLVRHQLAARLDDRDVVLVEIRLDAGD
eukprot:3819520-Prymnesium_polylepis.1